MNLLCNIRSFTQRNTRSSASPVRLDIVEPNTTQIDYLFNSSNADRIVRDNSSTFGLR